MTGAWHQRRIRGHYLNEVEWSWDAFRYVTSLSNSKIISWPTAWLKAVNESEGIEENWHNASTTDHHWDDYIGGPVKRRAVRLDSVRSSASDLAQGTGHCRKVEEFQSKALDKPFWYWCTEHTQVWNNWERDSVATATNLTPDTSSAGR